MIYRGKVTAVTSTTATVLVTDLDPVQSFGPLSCIGQVPAVGDIVLVVQVGSDSTLPDLVVVNPTTKAQLDGKVDKVTGVDNRAVRFDGTTGAIQSSGVTIDDNGGLTTTSNVTVQRSTDAAIYLTGQAGDTYFAMNAVGGNSYIEFKRSSNIRFAFQGLTDDLVLRRYDDSAQYLDQIMRWIRANGRVRILSGGSAGLEIGASGPRVMSGTGEPNSAVTAPPGSQWIQTDHADLTYLRWYKATGTGNTGWLPDFEGRWISYTPTLTSSGGTQPAGWTQTGYYTRSGKTITVKFKIVATSTGFNAGLGTYYIALPSGLTAATSVDFAEVGQVSLFDSSPATLGKFPLQLDDTNNRLRIQYTTAYPTGTNVLVANDKPWTWANGDAIRGYAVIEIQ